MPSLGQKVLKAVGESSFWKIVGRVHTRLYRLTGGRIGHRGGGFTHLLLTTTGRKSGCPRTAPLTYLPDGDAYVLVASNGGSDRPPGWWFNLQANPRARVQIGGESFDAVASTASPEERARLWPKVVEYNPFYGQYEQIANREIPVVILHRA